MRLFQLLSFSWNALHFKRVARWSPEAVAALQQRRLRRLLRIAVSRTAYYREKYRGIDIEKVPLAALPTTNKAELMAHFDSAVTDPRIRRAALEAFVDDPEKNLGRLFLDRYIPSHSSGTQGQPLLIVQQPRMLDLLFALQLSRGNVSSEANVREAIRHFFQPARLAVVALKRGFYPSAAAFEYFPTSASTYVQILRLGQTDPDLLDRLNEFRPTGITAYAGTLDSLALEALAGRLRLAPELLQITNSSETLTEAARDRLTAAFGVPILDNYATGECLFLSNGCPTDHGAHINADWAILEVVDEDNQPVPPGAPGKKVLITNLANTIQPFIRYEVNDIVTLAATPCRCGNLLPRVERIEGRQSDMFWVRDQNRFRPASPKVFKHALDHVREVREWQAVQTRWNHFLLRLELLPHTTLDQAHVRWALGRQLALCDLQGLMHIEIQVVPALGPDARTGKFRRTVSLGRPAEEQPVPAA